MGSYSFRKEEKLCKRTQIKELFERGSSFYLYPIKVFVALRDNNSPTHQVLFTVSSRNFKRAVDRNTIKRRLREAYRLNKSALQAPPLAIILVYTAKGILPYQEIQSKMRVLLGKIGKLSDELTRKQP